MEFLNLALEPAIISRKSSCLSASRLEVVGSWNVLGQLVDMPYITLEHSALILTSLRAQKEGTSEVGTAREALGVLEQTRKTLGNC